MNTLPQALVYDLIQQALLEDLGQGGDITSNSVIPEGTTATVAIVSRKDGIIAGVDIAAAVFKSVDPNLTINKTKQDGEEVKAKDTILKIEGDARSILTAERTALNFMGRMSGIATLTRQMVDAVGDNLTQIAATRKTTPGLRAIEKYAVILGGGTPHRMRLDDAVMIKDNHIAMAGDIKTALQHAKASVSHTVKIEIEVDTLEQLREVLAEGADIIMLDNMTLKDMATAVKMIDGRSVVEASGNVTLERIPQIAKTGVDIISSGALTHSAPNFDVGLDFID